MSSCGSRKRIQLEDVHFVNKFIRWTKMDIGPAPERRVMNRTTGYRQYDPLSWAELQLLDPKLHAAVFSLARRYGYATS